MYAVLEPELFKDYTYRAAQNEDQKLLDMVSRDIDLTYKVAL
jgi:hypothetical protein